MNKINYFRLYATCAILSLFFLAGMARVTESIVFFGTNGAPQTITLKTPEGALTFKKTGYPYFSFWLANPTYAAAFAPARKPLTHATIPAHELTPFLHAFPELYVRALLTITADNGMEVRCGMVTDANGDAVTEQSCNSTQPITSINLSFTKATSLAEKIQIFKESF